ncbi:unnamed protein product [Rotaria socialis]
MANNNYLKREPGLTYYGTGYDPYSGYENIENYGSVYQPTGREYPFGYGFTNGPTSGTEDIRLGGLGQQGISRYGYMYPTNFNPVLEPGFGGSKVRRIYMPNHIVNALQNLLQQSGARMNPFIGGLGGSGFPQIPIMPLPYSQIGSNYWPMPYQAPSIFPQVPFPIPCPPPMIQPIMPQIPMPYMPMIPQIPSQQPMPYPLIMPQIPIPTPLIPVPSIIPKVQFGPPPMSYPSMFPSTPNVPFVMPCPSMIPQIPFPPPPPIVHQQIPMPIPSPLPPMVPQQIMYPPQIPMIPQQQFFPQNIPNGFGGAPFYGGFSQGFPQCGSLNSYGALPSNEDYFHFRYSYCSFFTNYKGIGANILPSFSGSCQPGFIQSGLPSYGGYVQPGLPGYGGYVQPAFPGYGGYNQPAYPGYGGYNQPAYPGYGGYNQPVYPGYGGCNQPAFPGYGGYNQPVYPGYGGCNQPAFPGYGGYNQPAYPGYGGYNQPVYPGYGGYNQSMFPGYGGYNQPAYSGYGGYNQPVYPGYGGYNQSMFPGYGGYNQPAYPGYGGYNQPAFSGYGGYNQPGYSGYGGFNQLSYANYNQAGFCHPSLSGYGSFSQFPQGGWNQPGYGGFNQQPFGNFSQPAFAGFNQQPYNGFGQYGLAAYCPSGFFNNGQQSCGDFNQPGFNRFPPAQPQFTNTYPQQSSFNAGPQPPSFNAGPQPPSFNAGPQQAFNSCQATNMNISNGPPAFNVTSSLNGPSLGSVPCQPPVLPPASNLSPVTQAQFGPFQAEADSIHFSVQASFIDVHDNYLSFLKIIILFQCIVLLRLTHTNKLNHSAMIYRSFFIFIVLIGLSIVIARNDVKFRNVYQKRFARNNDHARSLHGHRQQGMPWNSGTTTAASVAPSSPPSSEQIACLSACQQCVEEHQIGSRMKKADDNCGPMCDCADSCFLMPTVEVGKVYGHNTNSEYGKECWWRVYSEMLNNDILSMS